MTAVTPSANATVFNLAYASGNVVDILLTHCGIVTLVRELQFKNAFVGMLVTLSGIVTLVSPLHPRNALFPMLVTLSGIVTLVRELQL